MRKVWSRMISCLVATTMVITSAGMPVMADPLFVDETKDYEVLTDADEILLEDPYMETGDSEASTDADETLLEEAETTDNDSSENDVSNEKKTSAIENEPKTFTSANKEGGIDEQIGLPIDIPNESDRDSSGNKQHLGGEGQTGGAYQNGNTESAFQISEEGQSTNTHSVKATDNTVQIYASGIYHNWDGISNVTQFKDSNGGMYYAINSSDTVKVCRVESGTPVSKVITLEKKHPLYGTAACDSDGNFYLVTGEENDTDDTSVETVFISKYDSNGNFIATTGDNGSSSLASYYGDSFYTKIPFEAGNCDAAISGDVLTVNYARKMYSGHQSNSAFSVNVKDMSKVSVGTFYESHSFAQRVVPVGTGFVYVSEGDCYNRTFTIYNVKKTNSGFTGAETGIFDFWVKDGALDEYNMYVVNENFAHMGGLTALTDGRVAFAAQSAKSLNTNASSEKEDVFIQIFDPSKDLRTADAYTTEGIRSGLAGPNGRDEVTNYGVKWLTSLSDTESISNVQIASTSDDRIVVFFEYTKDNSYKGVYYVVLDKDGNIIQPAEVFDANAKLNPCEMPVYTDGMICWVGNKNNESGNKIYAYSLELATEKEYIASGTYGDVIWNIDTDGVLTVKGKGDYKSPDDYKSPWYQYREQITSAKITLENATNLHSMFNGCKNLKSVDLSGLDTSNVTDMYSMFSSCSGLTSLDVSGFDTSKVTDMSRMFSSCSGLTSLDVSGFDTSKATNMSWMFSSCSGLTSLDVSGFDTSKATNMSEMFSSCRGLTTLDVSGFDTSKVTDMSYMFDSCRGLITLDVSGFDTSNVTDMSDMFFDCSSLITLDVGGFDTSKVTNMSYMFDVCSSLTTLDVSGFDTSNVTDMTIMFGFCSSLTALNVSNFDTSKVTNMSFMFYSCSGLTSLDVSGFDTSNVTDMSFMFHSCSGLTSIDVSGFDTSNVTDMSYMFFDCSSLITLDVSGFDTSNVTDMTYMFFDCSNLITLDLSSMDISDCSCIGCCNSLKSVKSPKSLSEDLYLPTDNWTNTSTGEKELTVIAANTPPGTLFINDGYVPATGVDISKTELTFAKDETEVLTATVLPDNATNKNVRWSSSRKDIATVNNKGKVTAVSAGEAIITATSEAGGFTASCTVTVLNKKDAAVTITESSPITKTYGDSSHTLSATASNKGTGTGVWTWTSSDEKVATVSNTGTVTLTGAGESVIKAHYESDTTVGEATVTLKVNAKTLGITWNNTSFDYDGSTHKPTATLSGVKSGDVCTVSVSGEQTNAGTYTVTATLTGAASSNYILPEDKKTCSFTINKAAINGAAVTLGNALTYTGSEQTQIVSKVTVNGRDLAATDYTITNNKGTKAGSYTLTVNAKENSNYSGSVTKEYTIEKKAITPTVAVTGNYTFTGSDINPSFTVKDVNTALATTDYTASFTDNKNAGIGKITVSEAEGGNYSFSSVTQNFTINKAAAKTLEDVTAGQTYTKTYVTESVAGKMPGDAGTLTFTAGTTTITKVSGSTTSVSGFAVDDKGNVSTSIANGTAGDVITLPVTISSTNYADSTVKVVVTLLAKSDAAVTITESGPITKTYGDDGLTLHADAGNKGTGTGVWTWESSDEKVATVTNEGAVTITGAGEGIIKAHYESDTTVGEATTTLNVGAKILGITWNNTSFIYDGASHKPTATISGVISGDDCTVTVSGEQTGAGTYTATASLSGAASGNYILPEDNKTCSFTISKINVSNLNITGASDPVSMLKWDKLQLGVTVTPANATDKTVKWSSSKPAVVTVDDTGLITAISDGEAVITAEANDGSGVKATLTVKVASVEVTGIELRATGGTVMVPGASQQIEALITPSNATDKTLTWASSDTDAATVDDNGLVTVKGDPEPADGTTFTITASSKNDIKAAISFTVKKPEHTVTAVTIDPKSVKADAKPGDTFRLTAVIVPDNATDKTVTWTSSNAATAEISPAGVVKVKAFGTTTITARSGNGISGTCELNIRKIPVAGITMNMTGGDDYLAIGRSTQLSAIITPDNTSVKDIVWTSSNTKLADVDENGVVTGKAQGKVTITAAAKDDNTRKASISLTVFDDSDTLYVEFAEGSDYTYTGKPIMPGINVYNRGRLLMQETDYTVKFSNNVNANDGTDAKKAPKAVVTGKTIAATSEAVFRILPKDIGDETSVSAEEVNVACGKTAAPLLYYGGTKLTAKDFTNPYAKDKLMASRAITVYGTGNFTGEREVWINVMDTREVKNVPKIKVQSFNPVKRFYNGQAQYIGNEEIVVVSASDKTKTPLVMGKDFFIAYPDDVTNVGTVKITVIGMGDYAGSAGKSYKIEAAKNDAAIKSVAITFPDAEGKTGDYDSFEYKPGGVLPAVEILVTHANGKTETLAVGKDYKVVYKDNTKAGVANKNKPATATITFLGNYKSLGKRTEYFYIDQADLGKANTYAMDKVITKEQPKYPVSEPIADIDGTTVNKKEYTVTYKVNDGKYDIEVTSKDKLYKALEPGQSIAVTVEIKAKADKNGALTGNYKGTAPACQYRITRADADKDLSKATVILQKKGDPNHKAVTQLSFTGNPIEIGSGEYSDYELYVYMGKKNAQTVLKEGTDFYVDYSNNVNAGKATVMFNGCAGGKCFGSRTFTFKIAKGRMRWAR